MTDHEKYHKPDIITLKEYFEARLDSLALAVDKQEAAYNIRFENLNEWRGTYGDLVNKAVTKVIFDQRMGELERRINDVDLRQSKELSDLEQRHTRQIGSLEQRVSNIDGRILGYSAGVGAVVLIIAIVAQLLNLGG